MRTFGIVPCVNALKSILLCVAALALPHSPARAETVKIGFIDILSGPSAFAGQASLRQLQEVVAQLNAGALAADPEFQIVPLDGKGSPQESTLMLRLAFDRGIRFVTHGGGSGVAFALVDAINKQADRDPKDAMVYLNYAAMDPGLTNDRCSFWHFRFYPSSEMQIDRLTAYLKGRSDVKKVYLLNQNYTHGQQVAKASRTYLAKNRPDVQIVGEDYVPIATVRDFAPYVAKIAASGADTVITSNWGNDLTLLIKAARSFGLNTNFFTFTANNPGVPTALGQWGEEKVYVLWNWDANAPASALEEIAVAYKKKYPDEDFVYAAHWYSMNMLRNAVRQAKSTDPIKVAFALEGMKYPTPLGQVEMRAVDHQLEAPIYLGTWAKVGSRGVKYEAERTGYGFRAEMIWDAYASSQQTSCQMKRPSN